MSRSVAIYFVKTELEALASEMIAGRFESHSYNILAYSGSQLPFLLNPEVFDVCLEFAFPHKRRLLSERRAIYNNLSAISGVLDKLSQPPEVIRIHLPRLSTSKTNYSINYLRKRFPDSSVEVCIVPHGLVSVALIPINLSRKAKFFRKKWNPVNLFFPMLDYYAPKRDLIGGMDDIVSRVYTFPGIVAPYEPKKIVELDGLKDYIKDTPKIRAGSSAMIIGQPLLKNGSISESAHAIVRDRIRDWLSVNRFDTVYYSKHPRSGDFLDFYLEEYELLEQEGPVEISFCEIQPDVVVSCYSTALATAKTLFGDDVRSISFGLSLTDSDKKDSISEYFKKIGVELL